MQAQSPASKFVQHQTRSQLMSSEWSLIPKPLMFTYLDPEACIPSFAWVAARELGSSYHNGYIK